MKKLACLMFLSLFGMGGCGAVKKCSPSTCSTCCTASGECVAAPTALNCGSGGAMCTQCSGIQACTIGACINPIVGGTGGGSAGTGGGTGGFGGGSAGGGAGGFGGGSTGGGTGGFGGGSTGGGTGGFGGGSTGGGAAGGGSGGGTAVTYTRSEVFPSCETLNTSTVLLSSSSSPAIGDDTVSNTVSLPVPFSFFGAPMTHYAVTSNGLLQFFSSPTGSGSSDYENVEIPNAMLPNGFAAPFWDDLSAASATVIRTQTLGTAPNRRMIVEWFDSPFNTNSGVGPERLRFQVKVFETSNAIEFHYCSLNANGGDLSRALGSQATIGLESPSGLTGLDVYPNQTPALSLTVALRFTP